MSEHRPTERDHARPLTVDQQRDRIDRGLEGDKVAFPDPAAAPLGTDEEAGGHAAIVASRPAPTAKRNWTFPPVVAFLPYIALALIAVMIVLAARG